MKRCLMSALVLVFMLFAVNTSGFAAAAPDDAATQLQVQLNGALVNAPPYMR